MNTSTPSTRRLRPFHTPVRGHVFSARPPAGAALDRTPLTLRREPDNPADPHAVAVWADGGGSPWRVGYLDRAVAVRLAGRVGDDDQPLRVTFAGWWEEPDGRWQRPVVQVSAADDPATPRRSSLRRLPPFQQVRPAA
jgi:hypothetical protein